MVWAVENIAGFVGNLAVSKYSNLDNTLISANSEIYSNEN